MNTYTELLWYTPTKEEIQKTFPIDYMVETWYFHPPYSDELLREFQIMLLEQPFIKGQFYPLSILELERLQQSILEQKWIFDYFLSSIPVKEIHKYTWNEEDVMQNLENIGAKSALFERHAWRSWFKRNTPQ